MKTSHQIKKRTVALFLVLAAALIGIAPLNVKAEPASEEHRDYTVLKGGYYYPSERISLNEFSDTDFDRRKGFNGEVAFGHYFAPIFGTEFGVGYLENRRFPGLGPGRTTLQALPVLLSAKLFIPIGPIEPYAEIGVGAYFTKLEVEDSLGRTTNSRDVEVGSHAGAGVNINFSDTFYVGVEGRYIRVRPEFDGQHVRLHGYTATVNLGFRY